MRQLQDVYLELPDKKAVMQNVEHVYAGMTYGRYDLEEFVVRNDNRGFQA